MKDPITKLRDQILLAALPKISENGWNWAVIEEAARQVKFQDDIKSSLFPNGLPDVVAYFSEHIDQQMLSELNKIPAGSLRTKDKIRVAILKRYEILTPYRQAVQSSMAFWAMPNHVLQGQRVLWRSSDRMWTWAGDTATDYNRQTKRAILSSILMATTMVWIGDESDNNLITQAFLDRRLENVMEFGRTIGTIKKIVPNLFRQAQNKT
jgi:ubiquinone biosynthesis protein COQ9